MGAWYAALGRGLGDTEVSAAVREPVSRSKEETFLHDLVERGDIAAEVRRLAMAVTEEVVADGRSIQRIGLKVRYNNFFTPVKSRKLPEVTQDPDAVATAAVDLLAKFELHRPVATPRRPRRVRAPLSPRSSVERRGVRPLRAAAAARMRRIGPDGR